MFVVAPRRAKAARARRTPKAPLPPRRLNGLPTDSASHNDSPAVGRSMLQKQPGSTAFGNSRNHAAGPHILFSYGRRDSLWSVASPRRFDLSRSDAVSVGPLPLPLLFSLRRYRSIEVSCSWRTTRRRRGTVCRVRRRSATCESGESSPHSKGSAPSPPRLLNELPADSMNSPQTSPAATIPRPCEETCFRNSPQARSRAGPRSATPETLPPGRTSFFSYGRRDSLWSAASSRRFDLSRSDAVSVGPLPLLLLRRCCCCCCFRYAVIAA